MNETQIREHLESGGVWNVNPGCMVVLDPSTRNLVVFYSDEKPRRRTRKRNTTERVHPGTHERRYRSA